MTYKKINENAIEIPTPAYRFRGLAVSVETRMVQDVFLEGKLFFLEDDAKKQNKVVVYYKYKNWETSTNYENGFIPNKVVFVRFRLIDKGLL